MEKPLEIVGTYKVVFIGFSETEASPGTGKTQIIDRYLNGKFASESAHTIGTAFWAKEVKIENQTKKVKLQMWDIAGQARLRNILSMFYKGANAIVIVLDVEKLTKLNQELGQQAIKKDQEVELKVLKEEQKQVNISQSVEEYLDKHYETFAKDVSANTFIYVVINKIDIQEIFSATRTAITQKIETWLKSKKGIKQEKDGDKDTPAQSTVFFTSAKTGEGINKLFTTIAEECYSLFSLMQFQQIKNDSSFKLQPQDGQSSIKLYKKIQAYYVRLPNYLDETQKAMMVLKKFYLKDNGWWIKLVKFFDDIFNSAEKQRIERVQQILASYVNGQEFIINGINGEKTFSPTAMQIVSLLSTTVDNCTDDKYLNAIIGAFTKLSNNIQSQNATPASPKLASKMEEPITSKEQATPLNTADAIFAQIKNLKVKGWGGTGSQKYSDQLIPAGAAKIEALLMATQPTQKAELADTMKASVDSAKISKLAENAADLTFDQKQQVRCIARDRLFNHPTCYRTPETESFYAKCARVQ